MLLIFEKSSWGYLFQITYHVITFAKLLIHNLKTFSPSPPALKQQITLTCSLSRFSSLVVNQLFQSHQLVFVTFKVKKNTRVLNNDSIALDMR